MTDGAGRGKLLLGIGNIMMGDDAAGMMVADRVAELDESGQWTVFKCGLYPEHFTRDIRKSDPELVVIVDAVDMALEPGHIRSISRPNLDTVILTTHRIPLSSFVQYIETFVPTCHFIGIQPQYIGPGSVMSPDVDRAVTELSTILSTSELDGIQILE